MSPGPLVLCPSSRIVSSGSGVIDVIQRLSHASNCHKGSSFGVDKKSPLLMMSLMLLRMA